MIMQLDKFRISLVAHTVMTEGGLSNLPGDSGGFTVFGMATAVGSRVVKKRVDIVNSVVERVANAKRFGDAIEAVHDGYVSLGYMTSDVVKLGERSPALADLLYSFDIWGNTKYHASAMVCIGAYLAGIKHDMVVKAFNYLISNVDDHNHLSRVSNDTIKSSVPDPQKLSRFLFGLSDSELRLVERYTYSNRAVAVATKFAFNYVTALWYKQSYAKGMRNRIKRGIIHSIQLLSDGVRDDLKASISNPSDPTAFSYQLRGETSLFPPRVDPSSFFNEQINFTKKDRHSRVNEFVSKLSMKMRPVDGFIDTNYAHFDRSFALLQTITNFNRLAINNADIIRGVKSTDLV